MTLLDRLRQWLFGAADTESPETETDTGDSDEPQLDPDNVTQVRSSRENDPVSQLRDVQEESENEDEADL